MNIQKLGFKGYFNIDNQKTFRLSGTTPEQSMGVVSYLKPTVVKHAMVAENYTKNDPVFWTDFRVKNSPYIRFHVTPDKDEEAFRCLKKAGIDFSYTGSYDYDDPVKDKDRITRALASWALSSSFLDNREDIYKAPYEGKKSITTSEFFKKPQQIKKTKPVIPQSVPNIPRIK